MNSLALNRACATSFHTAADQGTRSAVTPCSAARSPTNLAHRSTSAVVGERPSPVSNVPRRRPAPVDGGLAASRLPHSAAWPTTNGSLSIPSAWAGTLVTSRRPVGILAGGWLNAARNRGGALIVVFVEMEGRPSPSAGPGDKRLLGAPGGPGGGVG